MRFSSLIWKNLIRRPLRSGLTLIALATAISAVVGLTGIARGFSQSFGDIYAAHAVDVVVSRQGSADRFSSSVDAGFADSIGKLPEVDRAAGVLLDTLSLEDQGVFGLPTMGIETDSWLMDDYELSGPNDIKESVVDVDLIPVDSPEGVQRIAFLGIHLAERLGLSRGESFNLFDEPYRVAGVFRSPSTWENGALILPLKTLQHLTDRDSQVTYINVVLANRVAGNTAQEAIAKIEGLDPRLLALATSEFVETDTRMQMAGAMAWMTSAIALLIGSIGTLNTMLMSVLERTREIGILRAIGWPRRRIVSMIVCESCSLALVASLLGSLMAVAMVWALSQAPQAKGILKPTIDADVVMQGVVLALGIGVCGAILPAVRAAQMLPTEAFGKNE